MYLDEKKFSKFRPIGAWQLQVRHILTTNFQSNLTSWHYFLPHYFLPYKVMLHPPFRLSGWKQNHSLAIPIGTQNTARLLRSSKLWIEAMNNNPGLVCLKRLDLRWQSGDRVLGPSSVADMQCDVETSSSCNAEREKLTSLGSLGAHLLPLFCDNIWDHG